MRDPADLPFTFLRDLFDEVDADAAAEPAVDAGDEQHVAARAAVYDATANVLAAMRELLQATEDMVRLRRDRLTDPGPEPSPSRSGPPANGRARQRIEFTD